MGSDSVAMQRNVYLIHISVMDFGTVKMATMNLLKFVVGHCLLREINILITGMKKLLRILTNYHKFLLNRSRMSGWAATMWQCNAMYISYIFL